MGSSNLMIRMSDEHKQLCEELEKQELDALGGLANGQIYLKLLALYLLQNDLCNAKYLWKRIPSATKVAVPELALVWNIGQKMWQRDFPAIYASLNKEWSENVADIIHALAETTRKRALHLISHAYSSISVEDFSKYVGMLADQAVQLARQHGWSVDQASGMIMPVKSEPPPVPCAPSEEQLTKLTDFVAFLEN